MEKINFCSNCGAEVNVNADVCLTCGALIKKIDNNDVKKTSLGLGYFFTILSLIILPILFGPVAIYLGYRIKKEGRKTEGDSLIVVAIILMIISMLIGAYSASTSEFYNF